MPGQLRQACALTDPLGVVGSAPVPAPAARKFIVPVAPSATVAASTRPPMSGPVPSPFSLTMGAMVENPSRVLSPATRSGGSPLPAGMLTLLPVGFRASLGKGMVRCAGSKVTSAWLVMVKVQTRAMSVRFRPGSCAWTPSRIGL